MSNWTVSSYVQLYLQINRWMYWCTFGIEIYKDWYVVPQCSLSTLFTGCPTFKFFTDKKPGNRLSSQSLYLQWSIKLNTASDNKNPKTHRASSNVFYVGQVGMPRWQNLIGLFHFVHLNSTLSSASSCLSWMAKNSCFWVLGVIKEIKQNSVFWTDSHGDLRLSMILSLWRVESGTTVITQNWLIYIVVWIVNTLWQLSIWIVKTW